MNYLASQQPYVYGMHEDCGADVLLPGKGTLLFLVELGDNPEPHSGIDLSQYAAQGYGLIARLQYSWGGGGTFPRSDKLDAYMSRLESCVRNSRGVNIWQIGNEWQHPNELPDKESRYYPPWYVATIYGEARAIIHAIQGEQAQALFPPCAPWIDLNGMDWIESFKEAIASMDEQPIDGFALHTYSRGSHPSSITSQDKMGSYPQYYNGWPTLYDWLGAIPGQYQSAACYLTETNQINDPVGWSTSNTGWVYAVYEELNRHNTQGTMYGGALLTQPIRCGLLYRWPHYDAYGIEGNSAIIDDFLHAQSFGYTWPVGDPPDPPDPCDPCAELEAIAARLSAVEQEIDQINARLRTAGVALIGKET